MLIEHVAPALPNRLEAVATQDLVQLTERHWPDAASQVGYAPTETFSMETMREAGPPLTSK